MMRADEMAPPSDALAESVVLSRLAFNPSLIDTTDLQQLLVFPEHRWCWQAMRRTWLRSRDAATFFARWVTDLQHAHPRAWLNLLDVVFCADAESEHGWQEYQRGKDDDPRRRAYGHPLSWWLARLRRIAEARGLISAAHDIAAAAWRMPEDPYDFASASRRLEQARPPTAPQPHRSVFGDLEV